MPHLHRQTLRERTGPRAGRLPRRSRAWLLLLPCVLFTASCGKAAPQRDEGMRHLYEGRNTIYGGDMEPSEAIDFRIIPVARITARDFMTHKGGSLKKRELGAYAFLVRHPVHGNILIDLGYPEVTAEDPGEYPGFPASRLMKIHMEKQDHVAEKIGKLNLRPEDIDLVLFTHLHVDHMGDIRAFPGSRMLVHRTEWDEALRKGRSEGFRPDYLEGISPETLVFPQDAPYGPFDRSLDILGDGSIIAVATPGHTDGHVSYFIHTGDRSFFLTGDAAWVAENYSVPVRKGWLAHTFVESDKKAQKDTLERIHRLYLDRGDLLMVPGHDGAILTDESLKPYVLQ